MTTTSVCSSRCCEPVEHAVHSIRVGVVEKVQPHRIVVRSESIGDKLRTERRPTDPDQEHLGKSSAGMHLRGKLRDVRSWWLRFQPSAPESARDPAHAANSALPCAFRPGWQPRPLPAPSSARIHAAPEAPSSPESRPRNASGSRQSRSRLGRFEERIFDTDPKENSWSSNASDARAGCPEMCRESRTAGLSCS